MVVIGLAAAALATTVLWSIGRGRWLGLLGIRHFSSYPPLWLAILIGFGMWAILVNGFGDGLPVEVRATSWLVLDSSPFAAAALAVFAAVSWGASWAFARVSRDDAEVNTSRDLASVDFDWILRWVRTDDAIESAGDDQFGHRFVADRMARRIASSDGPSTLALLGERGAGKSTIGNLLAKRLSDDRGLVFVRVSLWPFENSQAAVRGIVDGVVAELSTRVDVVALTEVRQQYIEAIRSAGGRFESIASLLAGRRSAEKQLEAIGQLAIAAGLRVVLWIEDLERFAGSDELPENGKASRDVERLSPVRALLYLLDKSSAITVILATTSLEARFDLDKIARFIERPPQPKNAEVAKLFAVTRKACLGGHLRTIVDSAPVEAREPLSTLESEGQTKAWLFDLSGETNDPAIALCALVASPRSLKNTLRSVVDSWRTLAGEVDFEICSWLRRCEKQLPRSSPQLTIASSPFEQD